MRDQLIASLDYTLLLQALGIYITILYLLEVLLFSFLYVIVLYYFGPPDRGVNYS